MIVDQVTTPIQKARELLADGEWHDLEKVLAAVGNTIPPGKAVREMERARRHSAAHKNLPQQPRVHHPGDDRMVRSGQRRLATAALRTVGVEFDPPAKGGNRRVVGRKVRKAQ